MKSGREGVPLLQETLVQLWDRRQDQTQTLADYQAFGRWVATASDTQTARVWDAAGGQPVTPPLAHQGGLSAVAFSPNGQRVATASADGLRGCGTRPAAAGTLPL